MQIVRVELGRDGALQFGRRHAVGRHVADQREGQVAVAVEHELAGEVGLAINDDTRAIVGAEPVIGAGAIAAAATAVAGKAHLARAGGRVRHDRCVVVVAAGAERQQRRHEGTTKERREGDCNDRHLITSW